ncbi:MAG: hypothetical protein HONDAALG_00863 [Gammaproteobacteria bacterium]|nr:hypothetical protein [Gammaproteobacteria bacterium]
MKSARWSVRARLIALVLAVHAFGLLLGATLMHRTGSARAHLADALPMTAVIALGVILVGVIAVLAIRRWLAPLDRLRITLQRVNDGDIDVRAAVDTDDEFEALGAGIDNVVAHRCSTLQIEGESYRLHQSVGAIMQAVTRIAGRDLSAHAPVRDDATGAIAEALNTMIGDTAAVLRSVTEVATNVAETTNLVKSQSDHIVMLARAERENLEECVNDLEVAADAHSHIARMAIACAEAGEKALVATRIARVSVQNNVSGFQSIRTTLADTERRVRLLLDRCQEISGAVNLISHLTERTHVLALNASMHASAVGDAGRGFSAVADEVQRLAENTREMASQISDIVQSVQADTADTMHSLQMLSEHVQSGNELVDRSGRDMQATEEAAGNLVDLIRKIAAAAATQRQISATIRQRTTAIIENVSRTGAYLLGQAEHTDNLAEQAMALVESVSAYRLPEEDDETSPRA